jgi:hypothetical protein
MGCPVIVDRLGLSTMWRGRARHTGQYTCEAHEKYLPA